MKKILLVAFILLTALSLLLGQGNVAINETGENPDSHAMLDVQSAAKGVLIPRMDESLRNVISASPTIPTGLLIFNTTSNTFNYWDGAQWKDMGQGVWNKNGNDVYFNDGNVGIGTATPQAFHTDRMLEVQGQDAISGGILNLRNSDESHLLRLASGKDDDPNPAIFWKAGDSLRIFTANPYVELMRITDSGNLGIGTSFPSQKLDVVGIIKANELHGRGDQRFSIFPQGNALNSRSYIELFGMDNIRGGELRLAGSYISLVTQSDTNSFGLERIRIQENGNVGLGLSKPEVALHVAGGKDMLFGDSITGEGTKMFWLAERGAFRSGTLENFAATYWDPDSIGLFSFVGGGASNRAPGWWSFVGAGVRNRTSGSRSFVGGGNSNQASGSSSFIGGGISNQTSGYLSFIGGGFRSIAHSYAETVFGTYNEDYIPSDTSGFGWFPNDRLFVIGNGRSNGTRSNAVTVLKSGKVGIGTSNPQFLLNLEFTGHNGLSINGNNTGDAFIRFLNPGGGIHFIYDDISEGNALTFESSGALRFNTSGVNERMRISPNGDVGIGTSNPQGKLEVVGNIYHNGSLIHSDRQFKKDIQSITNALEKIRQLRGASYEYRIKEFEKRDFASGRCLGFIAQEIEQVLPELVSNGNDGYKAVNYDGLIPVLVEGMKEQQMEIDSQAEEITDLKEKTRQKDQKIEELEARLAKLESLMKKLTSGSGE